MRIFLFDWFGWSFLWLLPLLGRVILSFVAGKPGLQGRGTIRMWLGASAILCASAALEAMLRMQDGGEPAADAVGYALASGLPAIIGKPFAVIAFILIGALGLSWLFSMKKPAAATTEIPRATPSATPAPVRQPARSEKAASAERSERSERTERSSNFSKTFTPASSRRKEPWSLPGPVQAVKKSPATKWPPLPQNNGENRRPARPESEWAAFETLRPTPAMLARGETPPAAHAHSVIRSASTQPTPSSNTTRIRISSAGNAASAIPTTLRTSLQTRMPVVEAPPAPVATIVSTPTRPPAPASMPMPASAPPIVSMTDVTPAPMTPSFTTTSAPSSAVAAIAAAPISVAAAPPRAELAPAPWLSSAVTTAQATATVAPEEVISAIAPAPQTTPWQGSTPHAQTRWSTAAAVADDANLSASEEDSSWLMSRNSIPLPSIDLLDQAQDQPIEVEAAQLEETGQLIEQRLREFKVPVTVLGANAGPVITRFEIEPALGVRGAQIVNLMKDLSRALGLTSIRVVETIPGKTCMGLELPNPRRQMIRLAEIVRSDAYTRSASMLTLAMGKDITGVPVVTDLARAPHMLVAGTTGSGKSVAINAMILSLLYKATPEEVRLIMIDPKMLELSVYDGIPHLLAPVVTDMKLAANALNWCVIEMDKRYRLMSALGVRNLAGYNQKIKDGVAAGKLVRNPFSLTPDAPEPLAPLPLIVVVIDELADLMMVAGKKIEELIARLAQKARAAGIHLILATQRPSVDVITGLIKANIPTRVAFQVSSKIDSRTVLDQMGAEALLGHGDMLFLPPGSGYPQRVHGAFVSDEEVHRVVEHLKSFGEPDYEESILALPESEEMQLELGSDASDVEADPLYDEAAAYVIRSRRASISSVQRQFRIGYNRAARLVEQMESAGILSAMSRNGSRDVLAPPPSD